jgi:hypothetical protein
MIKRLLNRTKCADCVFVQSNSTASSKKWIAYECGNPKSEYHKSILNVSSNGEKHHEITWIGCNSGIPKLKTVTGTELLNMRADDFNS